jgi:hypothetical protein
VLAIGLVAVLAGVLIEGFRVGVASTVPGTPAAAHQVVPKNLVALGADLVPNPSMLPAAAPGLAIDLHAWGQRPRLADVPVTIGTGASAHEGHAELVSLRRTRTGGVWFTVPVSAGRWYAERIDVLVRHLDPGAYVSVNLEWYHLEQDGVSVPLGASVTTLHRSSGSPVTVRQFGFSPATANRAHVVVNVVGGGEVLVLGAELHVAVQR